MNSVESADSKKHYLEISKAPDLKSSKDRAIFRLFEALPAFLSGGTLITALVLSWLAPAIAAIFIILFDFFWLLKITYLSFHQTASYRQMKKNLKTDWIARLEKLKNRNWQDIYHLVILPMYKEGVEVVGPTFQSLVESKYPKEKMIVVLALEERAGEEARKTAGEIEREFGKRFFKFLITVHPKDIPGEVAGKGSNETWAVNIAKEKIIIPLDIPPENIIVSGFDIDTKPYSQYFACLTWHYLTVKDPLRASYQPIPVYNNNIWDAPAFSRVIASSGTFWQMMQQERVEQLVTYSAHSMPFLAINEVGYPSNTVADDSHIFWKSYFHYDGRYRVVPLHYPVSMDAVLADSFLKTAINQYKQQRRWAWGCIEIPYLLYGFSKNKKIPLREKIRHSFIVIEGFWSWAVAALLIFFLGWLPLMLGGESFQTSLLSYNLPRLTSNIMTVAMIGMLASAITSFLLLPPRPRRYNRWKNISMIFQWLLLPVTLIVFGVFPALDAQIRLFLGKYLGFWVTEKVRK
jgi:cellulose synthase/poly-beta-1,6-N-acetylglucosamine synthase-like glycosyltransferase